MERTKIIFNLLAKYNATFKLSEVETLIAGEPLPTDASPTLLDIEQSFDNHKEQVFLNTDPERINYNVE